MAPHRSVAEVFHVAADKNLLAVSERGSDGLAFRRKRLTRVRIVIRRLARRARNGSHQNVRRACVVTLVARQNLALGSVHSLGCVEAAVFGVELVDEDFLSRRENPYRPRALLGRHVWRRRLCRTKLAMHEHGLRGYERANVPSDDVAYAARYGLGLRLRTGSRLRRAAGGGRSSRSYRAGRQRI